MIGLIWAIWFANIFVAFICLLNFLIAIVSQSYDEAMGKKLTFRTKQRCEMNLSAAIFRRGLFKMIRKYEPIDLTVLRVMLPHTDDEQDHLGFVRTIKNTVRTEVGELRNHIEAN
jgi:hypothetical protein